MMESKEFPTYSNEGVDEGRVEKLEASIEEKIGGFSIEDYEGEWPREGTGLIPSSSEEEHDIPYVYNEDLHRLASELVNDTRSRLTVTFESEELSMRRIAHVDGMWYLANTLFVNRSLEALSICYGNSVFPNHPKLGYFIANALATHSNLKLVDLSFNGFVADTAYYLGRAFLRNSSIRLINLTGNDFTDKTAALMISALSLHPALEMLNLSRCNLGRESAIALAQLFQKAKNLREVVLDDNTLGGPAGLMHLMRGLPGSSVRFLSMCGCELDDSLGLMLADGIRFSSLEDINLSNNKFSDVAGVNIARAIGFSKLQTVTLDNNKLGKLTAIELGAYLSQDSARLRLLSLNQNLIGREGSISIAKSFENNSTLEELYLASNGIGPEFGVALGLALRTLGTGEVSGPGLKTLHLPNNYLGDEGVVGLVVGLKAWKGLSVLNLEGNQLGDKAAVALAPLLKVGPNQIRWLSIESNNIGEIGRAALSTPLESFTDETESSKTSVVFSKNLFTVLEKNEKVTNDILRAVSMLETEVATEGAAHDDLSKYISDLPSKFEDSEITGESDPLLRDPLSPVVQIGGEEMPLLAP